MARALARGWGEPVLAHAIRCRTRAQALADEVGGEAVATNAELAQRADVVVLCHKPAAAGLGRRARSAATPRPSSRSSAATPLASLKAAYPGTPGLPLPAQHAGRAAPGRLAAARRGPEDDAAAPATCRELFGRARALVVRRRRALIDVAMGLDELSRPAYVALVAEAQIDAGVRHGLPPDKARRARHRDDGRARPRCCGARGGDTLAVRREVTSPGGSTARGLAALERAGVRAAFQDALDAVLEVRS